MWRFGASLTALAGLLLVAGCTASVELEQLAVETRTAAPDAQTTIVDGTGAVELALAASKALYLSAPEVVLVGEGDAAAVDRGSEAAVALGVPLLVTPAEAAPVSLAPTPAEQAPTPAEQAPVEPVAGANPSPAADLSAEIARLGSRRVLTAGEGAAGWAESTALPKGIEVSTVDEPAPADAAPPEPLSSLLVLAQGTADDAAAVATARAAGTRVVLLGAADPRATSDSVRAIAGSGPIDRVLALGSAFGPAERLQERVATAATGVELPGGGQLIWPGRRMVALYGHPDDPGLGVLGEQPVEAAVARVQQLAAGYQAYVGAPVVPAFEIIVSVASGGTGSNAFPVDKFRPWAQAARDAGIYVVLDLQPGDATFLSQAVLYRELLEFPNVGLALDPEWRVQPGNRHMVQIGSVDAAEINEVGQWLDQLTRDRNLPQKVLMLHQFTLDMIANRPTLVTDYDDLQVVIHADGFGSPGAKFNTWNTLHIDAPPNVVWGWKNFYDEDQPTFTPEETMGVSPEILFVSYQ
jgi:hypothetical protein